MVRPAVILTLLLGSCGGAHSADDRYADGAVRFRGRAVEQDGEQVSSGEWSFFHANGELQAEGEFEAGGVPTADDLMDDHTRVPAVGRDAWWKFYDSEGHLLAEGDYVEGLRDDLWVTFYENGRQCCSGKFIEGREHGYHVHWDADGRKRDIRNYVDGALDGSRQLKDESGELIWSGEYAEGELISSEPPGAPEPAIHGLSRCIERAEVGKSTPIDTQAPDLSVLQGQ